MHSSLKEDYDSYSIEEKTEAQKDYMTSKSKQLVSGGTCDLEPDLPNTEVHGYLAS